jgi:hypothetical protein
MVLSIVDGAAKYCTTGKTKIHKLHYKSIKFTEYEEIVSGELFFPYTEPMLWIHPFK